MCWPNLGQDGIKKELLRIRFNFKVLSLPLQFPKQISILRTSVQTLLTHRHGPGVNMSRFSIRPIASFYRSIREHRITFDQSVVIV